MEIKLTRELFYCRKILALNIMRTFIFLFCTTIFGFTSGEVISQSSKVKIKEDITLTIDEVFKLISNQTDYTFIYQSDIFQNLPKVHLKKGIVRTKVLLEKTLSVGDFEYILTDRNTIQLRGVPLPNSNEILQQTIKGKVTDTEGLPLISVNVIINDNERGTTTDFDGEYSINVTSGDKVKFTYLGYVSQEYVIENQAILNVVLEKDIASLEEIVIVSTGYERAERAKITGSIEVITEKQLENRITTDITSRLEGVSSGLLLSNESDGEPSIIVGGQTTFSADKQPLIVVDGFPISGGINSINPNDIASISVLKDAAASAIWGTKSSNGVIVITTKSGSKIDGKFNISYSSDLISAERPDFSNLNQASASDIIDFQQEFLDTGVDNTYQFSVAPGTRTNWLDPFVDAYVRLNGAPLAGVAPSWTQEQYDARVSQLRQVDRLREIREHLYRATFTQRHNLSISGGTEKNQFFFSGLYQEDPSHNVGNNSNRYSFNLKDYLKVTERLGLELGANIVFDNGTQNNTDRDNILFGTGLPLNHGLTATTSMFDQNGNLVPTGGQITQTQVDFYDNLGFVKSTTNPIERIRENDNTFRNINLRLRTKLDYDITSWLNASAAYSYERIHNYNRQHQSADNYGVRSLKFAFTSINPDDSLLESFPDGGILTENNTLFITKILRGQLNIDKSFNNNQHNITTVIGAETRAQDIESRTDKYYGYDDRTLIFDTTLDIADWNSVGRPTYYGNLRYEFVPQVINLNQEREASYYANAVYTYDQKYVVSGSARIDQANLFGAQKKFQYAPLWSAGLAWNIHKESFLDNSWISILKPRVTFGYNARADRNTTTELVLRAESFFRDFNFNFRNYLGIGTRPNPLLTWETTFTIDVGADFSLFRDRLSGSVDYYSKKSEDLVFQEAVNSTYGFTSAVTNNGEIHNKGIDVNLVGKIIDTDNFSWTSNLLYSHNRNIIESVKPRLTQARFILQQDPLNTFLSRAPQVGFPVDGIFSWKYAGLDNTGSPQIFLDPTDPNSELVGVNEVFDLDKSSVVYSGQLSPKHYGGFINTFGYKNFNLTVSMSYKFGHVFRRPTFGYSSAIGNGIAINDIADRWQQPGDEDTTDIPGLAAIASVPNFSRESVVELYSFSDRNIEKADNIRLNTVSLSYDFPSEMLRSQIFKGLKITAQMNNIGLLWKATKTNYDPEFVGKNVASGISFLTETFPSRLRPGKEIIFGIRANF